MSAARVLLIDNYDSFTWNLAHGLYEAGASEVKVVRNDVIDVAHALAFAPTHLVISPGPGQPSETGNSAEIIGVLRGSVPILGVCLGHQLLVSMAGGAVGRAARPVHGKPGVVQPVGYDPLIAAMACGHDVFEAGRYHSLAAMEPVPDDFVITAVAADDGEIMAVRHSSEPTFGVQFHPESILSPTGVKLLEAFLAHTC